jgi:hypothetical protein
MSAPVARPALAPCTRCGGKRFLRVAPVREHGQGGTPTPMAVVWRAERRKLGPFARAVSCVGPAVELQPRGCFTVLLCAACGDTRWYARELDAELATQLEPATLGPCGDCGESRALRIPRVQTRGTSGRPSDLRVLREPSRHWGFLTTRAVGHFSLFVCCGCALTRWVAAGLEALDPHRYQHHACRRCAWNERLLVDPVDEDGAILRVLYAKEHLDEVRAGRYRLSICGACGLTDWTALGIDAIDASARWGVAVLDTDALEGPYR